MLYDRKEQSSLQIESMADDHRPISQVLHQAIATGDLDTVQALLQKGVNANSTLIARCPIDRYSLTIDVHKRQPNVGTDICRYSLGMDRLNNHNNSSKGYMKENRIENNNFLDYTCRDSIRETPIIESDYEDEDLIKKSVNEDDVVNELNEKNDAMKKMSEKCSDKYDSLKSKSEQFIENDDAVKNKTEKFIEKNDTIKDKSEKSTKIKMGKCVDEDEALRELLEKCSEDDIATKDLVEKCSKGEGFNNDISKEETKPIVYREEVKRPITPLFPLKPLETSTVNKMSDKRNDGKKVLVEPPPSINLDPRALSEELLIEEKPLKLIPKLKKKLSNRWRNKEAAFKDNKLSEKYVTDKRRTSRNVENADNEQLNENYEGLAFFEAVRQGMDMTVQTLLETSNNNQLNMPDENGFSPLMQAAWHGQQECLKVLLDHGANVSLRNNTGCTATHFAAAQGHLRCLDVLINYGHVDVNSQTKFSATPLILAAKGGHSDCVTMLLESDADVNMQYRGNQNALLFAAGNGHYETMEILIVNDVYLDQANSQGVTPLMRAIQQGHNACAKLLIDRHVDINMQDVIGRTPIHFAIEHDNPEGLKLLIEAGACADIQTRCESTPMDYLERFPSSQCEEILDAHQNTLEEKEVEEEEMENQKTKTRGKHPSCMSCFRRRRRASVDGT